MSLWKRTLLVALAVTMAAACGVQSKDPSAMGQELISAAERGDLRALERLIAAGADLNAQDERGRTAALAATHAGEVEAVRALATAGADLNMRDQRQDNVLLYAGAEGLLEIVRLAVAAGADTCVTNLEDQGLDHLALAKAKGAGDRGGALLDLGQERAGLVGDGTLVEVGVGGKLHRVFVLLKRLRGPGEAGDQGALLSERGVNDGASAGSRRGTAHVEGAPGAHSHHWHRQPARPQISLLHVLLLPWTGHTPCTSMLSHSPLRAQMLRYPRRQQRAPLVVALGSRVEPVSAEQGGRHREGVG